MTLSVNTKLRALYTVHQGIQSSWYFREQKTLKYKLID